MGLVMIIDGLVMAVTIAGVGAPYIDLSGFGGEVACK